MSGNLRLNGATSGYSELAAPDEAGDQTFTFPTTGGTLATVGGLRIESIVNQIYTTGRSTTAQSFEDTGLEAKITPKSATNKILTIVNQALTPVSAGTDGYARLRLMRDSTDRWRDERISFVTQFDHAMYSYTFLDSPASTSELTYKTQMATSTSSYTLEAQHANIRSSYLTLIELSGF